MFHRGMTADQLQAFEAALTAIIDVCGPQNVFAADDVIAIARHAGFRSDGKFLESLFAGEPSDQEKSLVWRLHVLCWAAVHAASVPGDFVQCGVGTGIKAAIVARYVDLGGVGKSLNVYDPEADDGSDAPGAVSGWRPRLEALPGVTAARETKIASIAAAAPSMIAWLHLDLAQAAAEETILEALIGRVAPNGLVIVEEYGSNRRADRVAAADRIAAAQDCAFLELPTGQGLLIKA